MEAGDCSGLNGSHGKKSSEKMNSVYHTVHALGYEQRAPAMVLD